MVMALLLCLLVLHPSFTRAAVYTVGGARGWSFDSASWLGGKRFKAGDILCMLTLLRESSIVTAPSFLLPSCGLYCSIADDHF